MDLQYYRKLFQEELLESCVPFWLEHGWDEQYGGMTTCLDRTGKVYSEDKSVWMQGRTGWMFSYIYNNIEKKDVYLKIAKDCIDFAARNCVDTDGRMFFTVTRNGRPLRKRRYWFSEAFFCMANAEYSMASGDKEYLETAKKVFDMICQIYKDPSSDPFKITPKVYAETRNMKTLANPMILLNTASVLRQADPERFELYTGIMQKLMEDIGQFHKPEFKATFENITADTNEVLLTSAPNRVINPGHDIECAWFLLEEGVRKSDKAVISLAETMFNEAFELGWDQKYGGIIYFKDILGKPVEAYEHDMKLWWPQNETIIASLMLYKVTGNEKYYRIFEEVCEYAFANFSDREHGEWFGYLRRDNVPTEPPCKGHTYKGPFHVMRMLAKCICLIDSMIQE